MEEIYLKENERIDDLEYAGLKIIQNKTGFCFGIDSILLSDFAKSLKKNSVVMDIGTGAGFPGRTGTGSLCYRTEYQPLQHGIYQ